MKLKIENSNIQNFMFGLPYRNSRGILDYIEDNIALVLNWNWRSINKVRNKLMELGLNIFFGNPYNFSGHSTLHLNGSIVCEHINLNIIIEILNNET